MSDPPKPPNGNGGNTTIVQAGIKLGQSVVHGLPAQFLALLLINGVVLAFLFWFVAGRAEHTAALINQLLQACLTKQ